MEGDRIIKATAKEYLDALQMVIDKHDFTARRQVCAPDCTFALVPASFAQETGAPADFAMTNGMWEDFMKNHFDIIASAWTEVIDVVASPLDGKAVVHLRNHIKLVNAEQSILENALFLYMSEDGKMVKKIVEFTDTAELKKYLDKLEIARQSLGKGATE